MAFQPRNRPKPQAQRSKPDLSVALSVKQGNGYVKGPSFGLWTNEQGGPEFRGNLSGDYLGQILEFLSNAFEANLPVSLAVFRNDQNKQVKKPGFKQAERKPNPFKQQAPAQEQDDADIPF